MGNRRWVVPRSLSLILAFGGMLLVVAGGFFMLSALRSDGAFAGISIRLGSADAWFVFVIGAMVVVAGSSCTVINLREVIRARRAGHPDRDRDRRPD